MKTTKEKMNTHTSIEEAVARLEPLLKPLYKSGSLDVFNLRVAIEKELTAIATESAEEERRKIIEPLKKLKFRIYQDNEYLSSLFNPIIEALSQKGTK